MLGYNTLRGLDHNALHRYVVETLGAVSITLHIVGDTHLNSRCNINLAYTVVDAGLEILLTCSAATV